MTNSPLRCVSSETRPLERPGVSCLTERDLFHLKKRNSFRCYKFPFSFFFLGIHLKLLVALVIAGVIMLIFLTLVVYSAKRRLDMDNRQDAGPVVYGKYTYLQQTEEAKISSVKNNSTETEGMELAVTQNGKQSNDVFGQEGVRIYHGDYDWDQHNGVLVEDHVRIKHGKYVQFSVPSTESDKIIPET